MSQTLRNSDSVPILEPDQPPTQRLHFPQLRPLLTYGLMGLIIALFGLTYLVQQSQPTTRLNPVLAFGVMDYDSILINGELYRLFTAIFLHLNFVHIFFNSYALYIVGRDMESLIGRPRFLTIYLFAGLGGSILSFIIGRGASLGASGAIFGMFGAQFVFVYQHRVLLGAAAPRLIQNSLINMGLQLGLGLLSVVAPGGVRIDNWGHIGGLIGGILMALAINPRYSVQMTESGAALVDERPFSKHWTLALLLAAGLAGIVAVAYVTLPR